MTVQKLINVLVIGTPEYYTFTEDAITALKCVDVTEANREKYHFTIEGWIPQIWFDDLKFILEEGSGGRVALIWDESVDPAVISMPIRLENPRFVRPFEYIVQLFSLPGRRGYDPTFLTFLTLPLFFGLVIGDFGYGLVFVFVGLYIRHRFRTPMGELASLFLVYGGLWSIVFGTIFFAEFFAFKIEVGLLSYHLFDKFEDFNQLLILSIIIGMIHLNLGLFIGFVYERRRAGLKIAFLKKISWFVLEAGMILLALSLLGLLAAPLWIPGIAIIAFAIALISLGGGMIEVVEVPALLSNIMSYMRLGILAIAKGALGLVINLIVVGSLIPQGIIGWILGGIIFIIGHVFIMALALITVGIHVLRLHYVEFYSKFYPIDEIGVPRSFKPTVRLPRTKEA